MEILQKHKKKFEFKIPFTRGDLGALKKKTKKLSLFFQGWKNKKFKESLTNSDVGIKVEEYLGIVARTFIFATVFFLLFFVTLAIIFHVKIILGISAGFLFSFFVLAIQMTYPRMYSFRKSQNLERNLISALQDMLVQLESGISMFQILSNISNSDYGEVSEEFKKAVRELNTGAPQVYVLEELIKRNGSNYFKRVLWQISNGLRSGSDMTLVIKDTIDNLNKEQSIQIQSYGSKLNPLVMFYMLMTVIVPAL